MYSLTAGTFLMTGGDATTAYTKIVNISEYPDIGSSVDTQDVTTLSDACHKYIDALPDPGGSLEFPGFLSIEEYNAAQAIAGVEQNMVLAVSFKGKIRVRLTGAGTDVARPVTYTVTPTTGFTDHTGNML